MKTLLWTLLSVLLCVLPAKAGFVDSGNGTATDTVTNLMWQQCTAGFSGTGCATDDANPNTYTWENAISYCEGLSLGGFYNWRLPNIKELQTIVDRTTYSPAINATYFPNTVASYYWSSTSMMPSATNAWSVEFAEGFVSNPGKQSTYSVRCIRGQ